MKTSMRNLAVVFALALFGSLLIDPAVLAQAPKLTTKIVPDDKYGKGGTKDTMLDEKSLVHWERWKDKDGYTKESHDITYNEKGAPDQERWHFFESPYDMIAEPVAIFSLTPSEKGNWKISGNELGMKSWEAEGSKKNIDSFIEKVGRQFAKDGTIPPNPFTKEEKQGFVDTKVEQPDLQKNPAVFDAQAAKAAVQKRAEVKAKCDGIREKIRTLQELLRKNQGDPATPKQDLETIRKQIDELLSQLGDCPKQEPIDVQFDCLKSKFPEIRLMVGKKDRAWDPTSKRDFSWDTDKQAWIDGDTQESICPPSGIDPCLVGIWECTSFKQANQFVSGGGTGFRVTFKRDGTETVDYSKMQPIRAGDDKMVYQGTATARISTKDGAAKIEKIIDAGARFNAVFMSTRYGKEWKPKIPELGPGGLGSTKGKNSYKCTGDSLEYQSSTPRGDHPDCTVKLTKVKP